jgi:hypothetical protein
MNIAVALLVGCISTLVITWLLAPQMNGLSSPPETLESFETDTGIWWHGTWSLRGAKVSTLLFEGPSGSIQIERLPSPEQRERLRLYAEVQALADEQGVASSDVRMFSRVESGWPFFSLRKDVARILMPGSGPIRVARGELILSSGHVFPYHPRLGGLLANIVIYAIGPWVLMTVAIPIRRLLRRRRGRCEWCAYSLSTLRSSVCPECGRSQGSGSGAQTGAER